MEKILSLLVQWLEGILTSLEKRRVEKAAQALEEKLRQNHEKVDRDNADVSDADGANKLFGPKD